MLQCRGCDRRIGSKRRVPNQSPCCFSRIPNLVRIRQATHGTERVAGDQEFLIGGITMTACGYPRWKSHLPCHHRLVASRINLNSRALSPSQAMARMAGEFSRFRP